MHRQRDTAGREDAVTHGLREPGLRRQAGLRDRGHSGVSLGGVPVAQAKLVPLQPCRAGGRVFVSPALCDPGIDGPHAPPYTPESPRT